MLGGGGGALWRIGKLKIKFLSGSISLKNAVDKLCKHTWIAYMEKNKDVERLIFGFCFEFWSCKQYLTFSLSWIF